MKKRRQDIEIFSLSFLDCMCCGFGAIILLFVLSKFAEPVVIEKITGNMKAEIIRLEQELFDIRGETLVMNRELQGIKEQLYEEKEKLARLQGDLSDIKKITPSVGGISVDSEYIIFIIHTSGSMQQYAWSMVMRKMRETLAIYPNVKGIQIMKVGVPIFIAPSAVNVQGLIDNTGLTESSLSVTVKNEGNTHFIIRSIRVTGADASGSEVYSTAIGGKYLLGGKTRNFIISIPAEQCLRLKTLHVDIDTDKLSMGKNIDIHKKMCQR